MNFSIEAERTFVRDLLVAVFPGIEMAVTQCTTKVLRVNDPSFGFGISISQVMAPLDGSYYFYARVANYEPNLGNQTVQFLEAMADRHHVQMMWVHWLHNAPPNEILNGEIRRWVVAGRREGYTPTDENFLLWTRNIHGWDSGVKIGTEEEARDNLIKLASDAVAIGLHSGRTVLEAAERGIILGLERRR